MSNGKAFVIEPFRAPKVTQVAAPWSDQSFLLEVEAELESGSGEVAGLPEQNTMNVNGGRPTCLYNDPSVFVKTEFDTGNFNLYVGKFPRGTEGPT